MTSLRLYSAPSASPPWRSWLNRASPLQLAQLFSLDQSPAVGTRKVAVKRGEKLIRDPSKVTLICFSKDRAFQLKEYLRTLYLFAHFDPSVFTLTVNVLYKATAPFQKSYEKLKADYPQVNWVEETDFASQLEVRPLLSSRSLTSFVSHFLKELVTNSHDYILWGVDDVLFFSEFSLPTSVLLLHEDTSIISTSLRLSPQINFCHPASSESTVPSCTLFLPPPL